MFMKKVFLFIACLVLSMGMQAQKTLPGLTYSKEPATLVGKIKNVSQLPQSKWYLNYVHGLGSETTADSVEMDADGTFTAKLNILYTKKVTLECGDIEAQILLTPGETTEFTYNPNKVAKKAAWTFKGPNSEFNADCANRGDEYSEYKLFADINGKGLPKLAGLDVDGYKKCVLDIYNKGAETLDADKNVGPAFKQYVKNLYQIRTFAMMTGYQAILAYANKKQQSDFTAPENYYDEVKSWPLFSQNSVLYTPYASSLKSYATSFSQFASADAVTLPESYAQLEKAQGYLTIFDNFQALTPEELAAVHDNCPDLEMEILDRNAAVKAQIEENLKNPKFVTKSIPENLAGEEVFKALIAPYKGKSLLVDFWATWCGPCKAAMKTILPVKEELWGKVNFIYVTGPSSPKATWNKMLPTIHGDHYYVTKEQWDTLLNQFESQGIPTYVIVDKDGNVVNKHIGYPGNEVMMEELTK